MNRQRSSFASSIWYVKFM